MVPTCTVWPGVIALWFRVALLVAATSVCAKDTVLTAILSNLAQVQRLQPMDNRRQYDLEAKGVVVTGLSDDFLRRRTPAEILKSGLSCGCGDCAYAFYSLMEAKGFQVMYIDAVSLSYGAVEHGDSGHTAVAVKDGLSENWILVDPTYNKIVSADWDPSSMLYESPAGRFWIGYKGPLDKYPVANHESLRAFYVEPLKTVPKQVWEKVLLAFDFSVDDSLKTKDGAYSSTHMETFLARPEKIYKALGIHPIRRVKVTLRSAAKQTGRDELVQEPDGAWTCFVADRGAMSASLTDWITTTIYRKTDKH